LRAAALPHGYWAAELVAAPVTAACSYKPLLNGSYFRAAVSC